MVADKLSRLPAGPNSTNDNRHYSKPQCNNLKYLPVQATDTQKAIKSSTLKKVINYVQNGCP